MRIFAKLRGLPRKVASRRAEELIPDLRLEERQDKSTEALADPPLMVLAEPTAGLDPRSRLDLWDLLRSYRRRGATVLLTTHNMDEAEALCDRVGIIENGLL